MVIDASKNGTQIRSLIRANRLSVWSKGYSHVCSSRRIFTVKLQKHASETRPKASTDGKSQKREKRVKEASQQKTLLSYKNLNAQDDPSRGNDPSHCVSANTINEDLDVKNPAVTVSRNGVLRACVITSGLMFALGSVARQASHVAFMQGWPILDSTTVSFDFEIWHLELIGGLVVAISCFRYILLKLWPDFAESSEAANQQVLSPLQPLDYVTVAFLSGIGEELLFRGALMPLFGLNWKSALVTGAVFGILHLGSGRRYSFAVWATFVGFAYGVATIASSSVLVPAVSHSLNNLVGAILWRYSSSPEKINIK
ncbi:hypothetical protein QJS10_CPA06g01309 [Acorus calamus]|uniref:CAAX prenyl protease 2/Lysostaphin resistance protein A-like domain-containing protein n=1 Tax=Acorus calamus TaxID=4465 RepID=A0AAV9EJB6_ACOCL|nr:hypothetical protein QJS10_CPA06g01309 [Acorus calamus]